MNETHIPQSVQQNLEVLASIAASGKELCFDESMLLSREGREILLYLRVHLGSKRFYINTSVEQNLCKLKDTNLTEEKAAEVSKALLFLNDLLIEHTDPLLNPVRPCMLTRDINLAEFLAERSSDDRVYILNNEKKVLPWATERDNNNRKAIEGLQKALTTGQCWLTSSALASSRTNRFRNLLATLPETLQTRVHQLDISRIKAVEKNPSVLKPSTSSKNAHIEEHNVSTAFPQADEISLLANVVKYSDKTEPLYIIWNDITQAEQLKQLLLAEPNSESQLERVGFCELSWYGGPVPLRHMNDNPIAKKLLTATEALPSSTDTHKLTVLDMAFELAQQPHVIIGALISRGIFSNPATELDGKDVTFLREKFASRTAEKSHQTSPVSIEGHTDAPQAPDEHTIRLLGPKLGQLVREATPEQMKEIIGNDAVKRELSIVYACRWNRAKLTKKLLKDANSLSSYCFRNWFKRSQNATEHMSQEDMLLNDEYYSMLREVISKSPDLRDSDETMRKLKHLSLNAVTQEARNRAADIMNTAATKGATIAD